MRMPTRRLGANEGLVGKFARGQRSRLVIATKFGIVRKQNSDERRIDNSPAYMRAALDESLQRLGTDYVDLYYIHRRSSRSPGCSPRGSTSFRSPAPSGANTSKRLPARRQGCKIAAVPSSA